MKKIAVFVFLFTISIVLSYAQQITKESCNDVIADGSYIPQVIIYGNESATYFTEYEKGKEKEGISSLASFDKDMKLITRFTLNDIMSGDKNKVEQTDISFYPMKNNIVIVSSKDTSDYTKYSLSIIGYDLKLIQKPKEVYTTNEEFSRKFGFIYSEDSTKLLFVFNKFKKFKRGVNDKESYCVAIDNTGKMLWQKRIKFEGIDDFDNTIKNICYVNNNVYFGISLGYQEMTNINLYGIAKKTETKKYNYLLYKYSITTNALQQILIDKNAEENYLYDNRLRSRNGILYLTGCYTVDRSPSAQIWLKYDGHYLIKINSETNKIVTSNFWTNEPNQKGYVSDLKFKENNGYYVISENNYTNSFSSSDNTYIYNFDKDDHLIWKKVIEKQHQGGNLQKGASFIYSIDFVKGNDLYILMNENKKNAALPINTAMAQHKNWDKGDLSCVAFIYGDKFESKKTVFNSNETGCSFYTSNPWYFTIHSKYMTERLNSCYVNLYQNRIYSIGGIDEKRKIATLRIE